MDITSKYKKLLQKSNILQHHWIPAIGDFWSCACPACIERDFGLVVEQADILAINPKSDLDKYWKETLGAVRVSRDFGFGSLWINRVDPDYPGIIWLPRLDQLINKATEILNMHFVHSYNEFHKWKCLETYACTPCSFEYTSIEQMALKWVNTLLAD